MGIEGLGELLFVGFDGVEVDQELRSFLLEIRPGGIILFKRNIIDSAQTLRLITDIHGLYEPRPIVAVDEEGGRVSRLAHIGATLPPASHLAGRIGAEGVRALARGLGRMIAALGFDLDFAPVVDLSPPEAGNGIGDRSFGPEPGRAALLAGAYLEGLTEAGVLGCLKHFPGLGPTASDSHHDLPTIRKGELDFLREDLAPYRRLHRAAPAIMVGHGHYPFLAGSEPVAATLVPRIATGLLREGIGFRGLAVADDLEMKAVADHVGFDELAPRVIEAGCDMVLVCRSRDAIAASRRAVERWVEDGRLSRDRVAHALSRVRSLRGAVPPRPPAERKSFDKAAADLRSRVDAIA